MQTLHLVYANCRWSGKPSGRLWRWRSFLYLWLFSVNIWGSGTYKCPHRNLEELRPPNSDETLWLSSDLDLAQCRSSWGCVRGSPKAFGPCLKHHHYVSHQRESTCLNHADFMSFMNGCGKESTWGFANPGVEVGTRLPLETFERSVTGCWRCSAWCLVLMYFFKN